MSRAVRLQHACRLACCVACLLAGPNSALAIPSALVGVATAARGSLSPEISVYGTVAADPDFVTAVAMPREAIVASVAVRAGQTVNRGDPVATIESSPGAATQFQQAMSTSDFASRDLEHTRRLFSEQLATKSQLAAAEKADADARASLAQQKRIGANQGLTVLRAPVKGVVIDVNVTRGAHVQADAAVASIGTRDRLIVNLGLEPEDAPKVAVGARVGLRSAQDAAIIFKGQIASVNAMVDAQSRLVNAVVRVPESFATRLILGSMLIGRIALPADPGIVIPRPALLAGTRGAYVIVVQRGIAHRRAVAIRLETGDAALISAGLRSGEQVVVRGAAGLEDGMAVRAR